MSNEQTPAGGDRHAATDELAFISLAGLLNILWRRRLLIILIVLISGIAGIVFSLSRTEKYKAIATVRPGITSFNSNGIPVRDWRIKDVIRWYQRGMYMQGVRKTLNLDPETRIPLIEAEFIPRGVGRQGGDVVTLSLLSAKPAFADSLLSASVDVFNHFAEINSVGNSLSLARDNLRDEILKLDNSIENVEIKRELKNLEIDNARQDLLGVDVERKKLEIAIKEHLVAKRQYADEVATLEDGVAAVGGGLETMEDFLQTLLKKDALLSAQDSLRVARSVPTERDLLWGEVGEDKTALAGELQLGTLEAQVRTWSDRLKAVELSYKSELGTLEHERKLLEDGYALEKQAVLIQNQIREMELTRDRALTQEIVDIEDQKRILKSRLDVLISLEKIGTTVVSDGPVYPKKRRMTVMATFGGAILALVLAFGWEYVSRNRREIFADD